jgi:hypothetical protein
VSIPAARQLSMPVGTRHTSRHWPSPLRDQNGWPRPPPTPGAGGGEFALAFLANCPRIIPTGRMATFLNWLPLRDSHLINLTIQLTHRVASTASGGAAPARRRVRMQSCHKSRARSVEVRGAAACSSACGSEMLRSHSSPRTPTTFDRELRGPSSAFRRADRPATPLRTGRVL